MKRATSLNPWGIRTYDHTEVRYLPAYQQAADAIGELQRALHAEQPDMRVDDFHQLLVDLAAARRILDKCPTCSAGPYLPYRVEHDDRGTTGHYECDCGHTWFCGWSITTPVTYADAA